MPVFSAPSPSHSADDFIQIRYGSGRCAKAAMLPLRYPFQQARRRRERQPLDEKPYPAAAHPDSRRQRNQEAQAVEATHQPAHRAGTESGPQPRDRIPGAALPGQQMSYPPDGERTQGKAPEIVDSNHSELLPFAVAADGTRFERRIPSALGEAIEKPLGLRNPTRSRARSMQESGPQPARQPLAGLDCMGLPASERRNSKWPHRV